MAADGSLGFTKIFTWSRIFFWGYDQTVLCRYDFNLFYDPPPPKKNIWAILPHIQLNRCWQNCWKWPASRSGHIISFADGNMEINLNPGTRTSNSKQIDVNMSMSIKKKHVSSHAPYNFVIFLQTGEHPIHWGSSCSLLAIAKRREATSALIGSACNAANLAGGPQYFFWSWNVVAGLCYEDGFFSEKTKESVDLRCFKHQFSFFLVTRY